jgi:hypothetical protein
MMRRDLSPKERTQAVVSLAEDPNVLSNAEYLFFVRRILVDAVGGEKVEKNSWLRNTSSLHSVCVKDVQRWPVLGNEFYQFFCEKYPEDNFKHQKWTSRNSKEIMANQIQQACGRDRETPQEQLAWYTEARAFSAERIAELEAVCNQMLRYTDSLIPEGAEFCRFVIHEQEHNLPYYHDPAPVLESSNSEEKTSGSGCWSWFRNRPSDTITEETSLLPKEPDAKPGCCLLPCFPL